MNSVNIQKTVVTVMLLSSVVESYAKQCPPSRITCFDIKREVAEIKATQQACCLELNNCLDQIDQELDDAKTCDQKNFIDQEFMNTATPQITQPGTYCLIESVTGDLVIDADNVTINMNNFTISDGSSLISSTNHNNIAIEGFGVLKDATQNGISFTTCNGVIIDSINFQRCGRGYFLQSVDTFSINNCSVIDSIFFGMGLLNTRNGKVTCCSLHDNAPATGIVVCGGISNITFDTIDISNNSSTNALEGVRIGGSTNVSFFNCRVNNNTAPIFFAWNLLDSLRGCFFSHCEANNNSAINLVNAFLLTNADRNIFDSCRALNNTSLNAGFGFKLEAGSDRNCFTHCLAKNNSGTGFRLDNAADCYFNNNTAINNAIGYDNPFGGLLNTVFLGNYAEGNGTNYSGVGSVINFDTSVGEFRDPLNGCMAVSPSDWSNISVEACP